MEGNRPQLAREGAPQALQCADRSHVVKNLTEAVQVLLARCQAEIQAENNPIISIEAWRPPEPAHVEKVRLARRAGRYARTVHRWLAAGAFPEAKKRRKRQSSFDAFAPYVLKRGPRRSV